MIILLSDILAASVCISALCAVFIMMKLPNDAFPRNCPHRKVRHDYVYKIQTGKEGKRATKNPPLLVNFH